MTPLLTAWMSAWALAQPAAPAEPFEEALEEARAARQAGDSRAALAALERAWSIERAPSVGYNIAVVREQLGDYRGAHGVLGEVLAQEALPEAVRTRAEARYEALAPKLRAAFVTLEAGESRVVAEVGGRPIPRAPEVLTLEPGLHPLRIRGETWLALLEVELPAGRLTSLAATPPELPVLDVRGAPGDSLLLDGVAIALRGQGPALERLHLPAGEHDLVLAPGTAPIPLRLAPGQRATLALVRDRVPAEGPGAGPWVLVATGAAALVAGSVLVAVAWDKQAALDEALRDPPLPFETFSQAEAQRRQDEANGLGTAGIASLGVAGASLAAGLGWLAASPGERTVEAWTVRF